VASARNNGDLLAEHHVPLPPLAELPSIEADDPQKNVEAMLAAGRVPLDPAIRWARVVVAVHDNGVPSQVMRFPITAENGPAIDWKLLDSDSCF
jgi:hypothetical protein